jgi:hypothetical protein
MSAYFLLINADFFETRMRPALASCRKLRSFGPCRDLCAALLPRVAEFEARYHVNEGESLVGQVARGVPYLREFWPALVGELLFYAADEIPEFQTSPDTLACLLAPEYRGGTTRRQELPPILQAHRGSRELTFGAAAYRPEHCGLNDRGDVHRLAAYLDAIDPGAWQADALAALPGLDAGDREEELAVARDFFPPLRDVYRRAAAANQVVVIEDL